MLSKRGFWMAGFVLGLGTFATMQAAAAGTAVQSSHRAVYDLALARSSQGAGVDEVDGRLVFEVNGSLCEGYTVTSRLVNRYTYKEGNSRVIDLQNTTFEAGDGKSFDYQEKEYIDAKLTSDKRTSVKRSSETAEAEGEIRADDTKQFKLAAGVLFPIQHQLRIIEAAQAGKTRLSVDVFDGSDNENPAQVVAVIGKRIEPGQSRDKTNPVATPLAAFAAWPVSLAYYNAKGDGDVPSFQNSFLIYENGIVSDLSLDYGDMVLSGHLAKLDMIGSQPACQ